MLLSLGEGGFFFKHRHRAKNTTLDYFLCYTDYDFRVLRGVFRFCVKFELGEEFFRETSFSFWVIISSLFAWSSANERGSFLFFPLVGDGKRPMFTPFTCYGQGTTRFCLLGFFLSDLL